MFGLATVAFVFLAVLSILSRAIPVPQLAATVSLEGPSVTIGVPSMNTSASLNATDIPPSTSSKLVFAHHMVGNTYSHTVATWIQDITLAHQASIDGFALNIGSDPWQPARVSDAFTAAATVPGFQLFLSFDMSVLPGSATGDADQLKQYITQYYDHPAQLKYNGKSFVSTFSGENCSFGQGTPQAGWTNAFLEPLQSSGFDVFFAPGFFLPPSSLASFPGLDAELAWNSAWATGVTVSNVGANPSQQAVLAITGSFDGDMQYITPLQSAGKEYMAAVSPVFYTHYSPQTYDKNWLYDQDWSGYAVRWNTLIQNRDKFNFIEILTWNDYGESSYIGPIGADQPNSQAWVDGFNHTDVLGLTSYFAQAFKTGTYPTISQDQVYLFARPHTHDAQASGDSVGQPTGWNVVADNLFADVLLTAPATIILETQNGNGTTFQAPAGHSSFTVPLTVGGYISATIQRNGQTVLTCQPSGYTFSDTPVTYNFNFFIASCAAPEA